jgi:hypothetical protein
MLCQQELHCQPACPASQVQQEALHPCRPLHCCHLQGLPAGRGRQHLPLRPGVAYRAGLLQSQVAWQEDLHQIHPAEQQPGQARPRTTSAQGNQDTQATAKHLLTTSLTPTPTPITFATPPFTIATPTPAASTPALTPITQPTKAAAPTPQACLKQGQARQVSSASSKGKGQQGIGKQQGAVRQEVVAAAAAAAALVELQ